MEFYGYFGKAKVWVDEDVPEDIMYFLNTKELRVMEKLKPCPFCGATHIGWSEKLNTLACSGCPATIDCMDSKQQAVEWWNKRASGWISVEDGPPPEDTDLLVLDSDGMMGVCWFDGESWDGLNIAYFAIPVTHWQPLPEPPEEEDD